MSNKSTREKNDRAVTIVVSLSEIAGEFSDLQLCYDITLCYGASFAFRGIRHAMPPPPPQIFVLLK
jgi:hypothetical protein